MVALHSPRFSIYFAKTNTISIIHNHRDRSKERNKNEPIWHGVALRKGVVLRRKLLRPQIALESKKENLDNLLCLWRLTTTNYPVRDVGEWKCCVLVSVYHVPPFSLEARQSDSFLIQSKDKAAAPAFCFLSLLFYLGF
jgi:hypothetical protein